MQPAAVCKCIQVACQTHLTPAAASEAYEVCHGDLYWLRHDNAVPWLASFHSSPHQPATSTSTSAKHMQSCLDHFAPHRKYSIFPNSPLPDKHNLMQFISTHFLLLPISFTPLTTHLILNDSILLNFEIWNHRRPSFCLGNA